VYISFSGGKDSTVLLDIVRRDYPDVPAVFVDTGLEYPEIREFVKKFENVTIVRPTMNFRKVIDTYGYPFFSKEVSNCVAGARKYLRSLKELESLDRQTDRRFRMLVTWQTW
jgi:3'-phosphoadenosine 5'-phosphosulfate sulfotransferase (PAPS reductase)/FAD synthetase